MKKKQNRMLAYILITAMIFAMFWESNSKSNVVVADNNYSIMGNSNVTVGQLINYYQCVTMYPAYYSGTDAPSIYDFCRMYIEECNAEGVRVEVAFSQAMKETNFLRYTGRVPITAKNFAGLGAIDSDVSAYASFPTVRCGIRAHVQHLKAYASTAALNNGCVDPRFSLVTRGCAPYVEWLGQKENPYGKGWATAQGYGLSLRDGYIEKLLTTSTFTTWYQGIDYSPVYDPSYYMLMNPDVQAAFGSNGALLISHFVNYGMNEGRNAKASFNVHAYKALYKDLRTVYGNANLNSYYMHYIQYGCKEGRKATGNTIVTDGITSYHGMDYSAVYNYNYYISHNPDVARAFPNDDIQVLDHFVKYGMQEGRQACANFNVKSYRNQYADLRRAYGTDLKSYYMHYSRYGKNEGREGTGCEGQLCGATTIYNGVDYASVYDFYFYTAYNPDVLRAYGYDEDKVLAHFVSYGMDEGRQAKSNYNVYTYKNAYADLQSAFGNHLKMYYIHYINYGVNEGRQAI